jgi:hypothetical protein
MVLKEHLFSGPVFTRVILDSPAIGKQEVDWRNGDPVGARLTREENEVWSVVFDDREPVGTW